MAGHMQGDMLGPFNPPKNCHWRMSEALQNKHFWANNGNFFLSEAPR